MDSCAHKQPEDIVIPPSATILNWEGAEIQRREDSKSPLLRALRAHFETYTGLTEPRIEIANIALGHATQDDI
jgi:hypothetical protein